jgi:LCP family protein required for cell wall assembly
MFDHLDDPAGFAPSRAFRDAVTQRGRRLRLRRRLGRTAGAAAVVLAAVSVAGATYVDRRDDAIDRVEVATTPSLDGAVNILLVGTDERPAGDDAVAPGSRADTIVVVRVAEDGAVSLLSIPRDLVVPATGERINAAYLDGGPQGLIDAVVSLGGMPVDHYVQVGMEGFAEIVDDLGGVTITVDRPLEDHGTGLALAPGPCQRLDGVTALQLVRSRHVGPGSDLDRQARGQVVIRAALGELQDVGADPVELDRLARTLADHASLDSGLGLRRLVGLATAVGDGPGLASATILPVAVAEENPNLLTPADGAQDAFEAFGAPPASTTTTVAGQSMRPPLAPLPAPPAADVGIRVCEDGGTGSAGG